MRSACLPVPLLLFSLAAFAVQDCELNGAHVNPANGNTTEGKTGIMRCKDRDSGQLVREEELRGGRFVGLVRYYKDGRLEREYSVNERHNQDGRSREFYADGRVAREAVYRDGRVVGASRSWYANGLLKRVAVVDDDGRERALAEFTERGQLRELRCGERPVLKPDFDDAAACGHSAGVPAERDLFTDKGIRRGRVTHQAGRQVMAASYWDNGQLREQRDTGADAVVERSWSANGVLRSEVRWRLAGQERERELEREYHDGGSLVRERRWQGGELAAERTWYLNGQPKTVWRFASAEGRRSCQVSEFHDNGKPMREGTFLARNGRPDRPIGAHRQFEADGQLRFEREYDDGGRLTREREYGAQGRLVRDDAVFEDGSRRAYATPAR